MEELMSSLFWEVSVHLIRSICETMNNLPAWEPVPFREIQPENWSNENICHKQRAKKEGHCFIILAEHLADIYTDIRNNTISKNDLQKLGLAINANGQILLKLRPYLLVTYSVSQVGRISFKEFGIIFSLSFCFVLFVCFCSWKENEKQNTETPFHI